MKFALPIDRYLEAPQFPHKRVMEALQAVMEALLVILDMITHQGIFASMNSTFSSDPSISASFPQAPKFYLQKIDLSHLSID